MKNRKFKAFPVFTICKSQSLVCKGNTDKQQQSIKHSRQGKIAASQTGKGLLYQQLLPTLKKDIPGFQQTCPSNINHTQEILENHH